MDNLQKIERQQNKYDQIIEYLKQDNKYWLDNDKWDLTEEFFIGKVVWSHRNIDFSLFENLYLKNELKYYIVYSFKENLLKDKYIVKLKTTFKHLSEHLNKSYKNYQSFKDFDRISFELKFKNFLLDNGFSLINNKISSTEMNSIPHIFEFIKSFYDDREETEKDIWYVKNIKGVKYNAAATKAGTNCLNFMFISVYYRELVKKYFRTIITKKSFSHCYNVLTYLNYFFKSFYERKYNDGFLEELSREDIEKYIVVLMSERSDKSKEETNKYISQLRIFIEKIQIFEYDKAPKKDINKLIFTDDIPRRERKNDIIKRVKFIPEPILKQLDKNISELDSPQFIPMYILLRETGWRGTDILNLRYNNCLEQVWNNKDQNYNYYLCGEITKTGIAQLKIPIRDKVANMVQKDIDKAKELSTEKNNPKKYLFNTYGGKLEGKPLAKHSLLATINRLIDKKDIRDSNGELYHFRLHSLRHTRAKEYVEQGVGISVIQQILGHQSLQMTVHYATVSENILYEKWKNTEDLELFNVNAETNELTAIDVTTDVGENFIRYEYVKKNLDAVRVPFGVCFKPSKLPCKQQMNHCLTCASFCTTIENIPEYEEEIEKVKLQIEISNRCGRDLWCEKNSQYLSVLEETLRKIKEQKLVHKNSKSREDL
ncbi:tyrosine-type recombinase/integrase [Clostridium sp.]|uniref:tyrosine-type recombinase/integrase n=1 Tax=Clostridium sp. TaxID=1506 RepID=UPI003F3725D2